MSTRRPARRPPVRPRRRAASPGPPTPPITSLERALAEAQAQQAATAEVLKIISSSPGNLERVFATVLKHATELCGARFGALHLVEGEVFRTVALHNAPKDFAAAKKRDPIIHGVEKGNAMDRVRRMHKPVQIADVLAQQAYTSTKARSRTEFVKTSGVRSLLAVPLLKDGELIGIIIIYRQEVRRFTVKQIELVTNFAAQAVIAIENTRLLSELRQSLQQQTATADVLKVISRSAFDLQSVLDTLTASAFGLCDADMAAIARPSEAGHFYHVTNFNFSDDWIELTKTLPLRPGRGSVIGRSLLESHVVQVADVLADPEYTYIEPAKRAGYRTFLAAPMVREGQPIGVLVLARRRVEPFTERQVELISTFADQAVIAIENARLFDEVKKRTDDLSESLEQQTATSDVLKVISRSPGELGAVFDSLLDNAIRICGARFGNLFLYRDGAFTAAAMRNAPAEFVRARTSGSIRPGPDTALGRVERTKQVVQLADLRTEPQYTTGDPVAVTGVKLGGIRTLVSVPMLKDGQLIGAINIYRHEVRPFTERQVELLGNFAAQAVIAIENARLLNELRQRTDDLSEALEQQTGTSEVLKAISRTPGELAPIFAAMLENATRICQAKYGMLWLAEGDGFRAHATHGLPAAHAAERQREPVIYPTGDVPLARLKRSRELIHIADIRTDNAYITGFRPFVALADMGGARTFVLVPMEKEGELVGAIAIFRQEVRPFSAKQIELVTNFAAQAVIAIENARLLSELRQRTDDLTESLAQQTATSEVLKVISGSPGELEPVFQAMLSNAMRICEASFGIMFSFANGEFRGLSWLGIPPRFVEFLREARVWGPETGLGRVLATKKPVHIIDAIADRAYDHGDPDRRASVDLGGVRTFVIVPMLKEGELIGAFSIFRQEVHAFTDKQIELVSNFAAQAVIAIENARLLNELRKRTDDLTESLEQQTATSEVLKVISSSPGELRPVFDAMLGNATRICDAKYGILYRFEDGVIHPAALTNVPAAYAKFVEERGRFQPAANNALDRVIKTKKLVHSVDETKSQVPTASARLGGARTQVIVPMLKDGALMGTISIYRQEVRPFSEKQIELLQNFAAQAVIAIENARLLSELRQRTDDLTESLEQQTATSEVLDVISRTPGELAPVFDAMLTNAVRICDAGFGMLWLYDGAQYRAGAFHRVPDRFREFWDRGPRRPTSDSALGRVAATKQTLQITDLKAEPGYAQGDVMVVAGVDLALIRSFVVVPMLKDDDLIGAIGIYQQEVRPFTEKQVALVINFAAQAVIAIENARLLSELHKRTDDLTESLEYQTATGEILGVISKSPTKVQPVFDIIAANALRLCGASWSAVLQFDGETIELAALHNLSEFSGADAMRQSFPRKPSRTGVTDRAISNRAAIYVPNVEDIPDYDHPTLMEFSRSVLSVPMIREGQALGAISVVGTEPDAFTDRQMALLRTFADQAVIAIENVRLFDEVQKRTVDLTESLQQQTATADVLEVISRSAFDLQPVFDTVAESCVRLCGADRAFIFRFDGEMLRMVAAHNSTPEFVEWVRQNPIRPGRHSGSARAALERRTIHIPDVLADPEYTYGAKTAEAIRTILGVPILKGDELLGVMMIYRLEVRPFSDKQIALVETFADQAAIAIENVRLFEEVQKRTEDLAESLQQQTATADVLKVISRSTFDLQTVLDTLTESAARLCEAEMASITRQQDDAYYYATTYGLPADVTDFLKGKPHRPGRGSVIGRTLVEAKATMVSDVLTDPEYTMLDMQQKARFRTVLGVPLLRDSQPLGVITLMRREVRPFTQREIDLVTTFADQAGIAIENVRLFDEIQEKSRQLEEASQHKSRFLANMSHELRTPLNAILGYTELIQDSVYGDPPEKMLNVLDRIMRNGKHLLGLINDVLDLSKIEAGQLVLSLDSYSIKDVVHGVYSAIEPLAVSKHLAFTVDMPKDLPSGRGDERRLTQVLLNLVGNAIKFTDKGEVSIKASASDGAYNVAVHDTGPGISQADQQKLFQEFQQADNSITKAKGGTGLGLAISKRIIEMHGGRIWVESRIGEGSTFSLTFPIQVEQAARLP